MASILYTRCEVRGCPEEMQGGASTALLGMETINTKGRTSITHWGRLVAKVNVQTTANGLARGEGILRG